ncbi:hypothetical protein ACFFRR_010396 [Megaselia abdita]
MNPAFFIFISGGMKMSQNAMKLLANSESFHSAWFYLAMVGSLLGPLFGTCVPYKYSYMISSAFVIFGGIISITNIVTSDCLDGIAFGMTMVATIAAGAENLKACYRGRVLSVEVIGVSIGMVIYCVVYPFYAEENDILWFKLFGYISIGCGLAGLICSFYANNSPIHYIMNKAPTRAIHAIQKMYKEKRTRNPSQKVLAKFSELDKYVRHETSTFGLVPFGFDLLAGLKIGLIRILVAIVTSSSFIVFFDAYSRNHKDFAIATFFLGSARLFGALFFVFLIDWIGRKKIAMASFFGLGISIIVLGVLFGSRDELMAVMVIPVVAQFFTGLGEGVSTVYMSEAFSLKGKTVMICILVDLECAALIVLNEYKYFNRITFCILGVSCLTAVALIFVFLPETKKTSLTEARKRFSSVFCLKF